MSQKDAMRDALALAPDDPALIEAYARTCLDEEAPAEAVEVLVPLLERDPAQGGWQLLLARALHLAGRRSEAIVRLETFLTGQPDYTDGWALLSDLLREEGNFDEADEALLRSIEVSPQDQVSESEARNAIDGWNAIEQVNPPIDLPISPRSRRLRFEDVVGMERIKSLFETKILRPLTNPEMFRAYGRSIGAGLLLYGPPGCGKSRICQAVAGEADCFFRKISLEESLDLWASNREQRLHDWFEEAGRYAPAILFFDAIDVLLTSRTRLKQVKGRSLVNQFLAELDAVQSNSEGLFVIGATNAPWQLDSASRRPGRLEHCAFVPPPDLLERTALIHSVARGNWTDKPVAETLANKTAGFSRRELLRLVEQAEGKADFDGDAQSSSQTIELRDLLATAKRMTPDSQEWFATARKHALYSDPAGFYEEVLAYLKQT